MSDRIYDDYTDAEIEAMEREFDAWLQWCDSQNDASDRLISSATPQGDVANAQHKTASC